MADMTVGEKVLWDYIEEESDELLLKLVENVERDGFDKMAAGNLATETVAIKIISAALVKLLQVMCEKESGPNLAVAYLQLSPMHAELVKLYLMKEMKLNGS